MSYTQTYYHIVYSTKNRVPVLVPEKRHEIFAYLYGILQAKNCHLYRLGGVDDHIHFLTSLHPSISLMALVRDLKTSSTAWIKSEKVIPNFPGWQDQYAAFTKSYSDRDRVIEYIKGQEQHHRTVPFLDELKALLQSEGVAYDERYLK